MPHVMFARACPASVGKQLQAGELGGVDSGPEQLLDDAPAVHARVVERLASRLVP